jgi:hypothetical protein
MTDEQAAAVLANMPYAQLVPHVDAALDVLALPLPQPVEVLEPIPEVNGPTTTTTGPNGTTTVDTDWTGDASSTEPDVINWTEETVQTNPDGTTETTTEAPESQSECEKSPDTVGCMQPGEPPEGPDIEQVNIPISITPQSFGATNASCPQGSVLSLAHGNLTIEYTQICAFAQGVRPVVLAVAWLIAALIIAGVRTSSSGD